MARAKEGPSDFSIPFSFDLLKQPPSKTIDIGKGGLSLSLDAGGRILQTSTFHPKHGIIVAVPFDQFDGTKFYDPTYVRAYRKRMLSMIQENQPGFGLNFGPKVTAVNIQNRKANAASFSFHIAENIDVSLEVCAEGDGEIIQSATIHNQSGEEAGISFDVNLRISLNRASYGQLTEGGPIPLPESRNTLRVGEKGVVEIANTALGAQLRCSFEIDGDIVDVSHLTNQEVHDKPLDLVVPHQIRIPTNRSVKVQGRFRLSPNTDIHIPSISRAVDKSLTKDEPSPWKHEAFITTYILRRNVDYILANCSIPVSPTATCIIADHVALPLGWNRDNYWQIRLLLETHKHQSTLLTASSDYATKIHTTVKGHLTWVYKLAQRPHGYWHRSYLVTGIPKDEPVFQLDQQCYPLLELCDYLDCFRDEVEFVKELVELDVIPSILQILESKRDADTGLWPTDETPGDDAVIYPYHFSSHVLLWRTITRLRDLYFLLRGPKDAGAMHLDSLAQEVHQKTVESFVVARPGTTENVFAYLTNGHGAHTFYHDANDIPTLFAPSWSFVSPSMSPLIETWHNTLRFAFSPSNTHGYVSSGNYPGLGSVHSPGPWVLGFFQELAYAVFQKDEAAMKEAWRKIKASMQWDGTFSEAVDAETGECSSKAWFSWPGSMIGVLIIGMREEGLEGVLVD
ncbi:hypothetical protein CC80DRAFT_531630 [Byssothecium circinans]|uniref:Six-hairpin glycosidase n=1 Tax=Byssothecium circinans TaxID=147558 RepID=A0A6A5UAV3_9PLEO|nr:hypothetical protein CC80DRAFT_531630 [Byssothecium circinans]